LIWVRCTRWIFDRHIYIEWAVVQVDHVGGHLILIETVAAAKAGLVVAENIPREADARIKQVIVGIDNPAWNTGVSRKKKAKGKRGVLLGAGSFGVGIGAEYSFLLIRRIEDGNEGVPSHAKRKY
jgi:hypothetical protein